MQLSERTKIEFEYEGKPYRLYYTANTLKRAERNGLLRIGDLEKMVITAPEIIFQGSFLAEHGNVTKSKIGEIYQALKRTAEDSEPSYDDNGNEIDALGEALANMLTEAVEELSGRGKQGNVSWKVVK